MLVVSTLLPVIARQAVTTPTIATYPQIIRPPTTLLPSSPIRVVSIQIPITPLPLRRQGSKRSSGALSLPPRPRVSLPPQPIPQTSPREHLQHQLSLLPPPHLPRSHSHSPSLNTSAIASSTPRARIPPSPAHHHPHRQHHHHHPRHQPHGWRTQKLIPSPSPRG